MKQAIRPNARNSRTGLVPRFGGLEAERDAARQHDHRAAGRFQPGTRGAVEAHPALGRAGAGVDQDEVSVVAPLEQLGTQCRDH